MKIVDIFFTNFQLPGKVCILAPGPNGRGHYEEIPSDYEVIAVSKAVLIAEVPRKSIWMMCHSTQDWFLAADAAFRGTRVFGLSAIEQALANLNPAGTYFCFRPPRDMLELETISQVDGAICLGTSVSGCALQFAYNFGAREILLCGVDMSGDGYWDGSVNLEVGHGEVWHTTHRFNHLIRWMEEERGVKISSLSKTQLQVRSHRP